VEAAVSLAAAWMARSPALLAFGGDSAIELLSAIVVLWRFRAHADQEQSEKQAARIAAVLLFILAAYVAVASALTLLGYSEPNTTYVGIAVLVAATAIMPWLAKEKAEAISNHGKRRPERMPLSQPCAPILPWSLWLALESTRFGTLGGPTRLLPS